MANKMTRRQAVFTLGTLAGSALLPGCSRKSTGRVVVIGGGFGGATAARFIKRLDAAIDVTLVEMSPVFTACPFSNLVIGGLRELTQQQFTYNRLKSEGVHFIQARATDVDTTAHRIVLEDGSALDYDRLVLSPGIDIRWDGLRGYDQTAAESMPHAWRAGVQTTLLQKQLHAMEDGGLVVISAPDNPFRCPPGPYERASLIAHYLLTHKPRAKLLILDAKDSFSKKGLFMQSWAELYGERVEWQGVSDGARVVEVDAARNTLRTDFDNIKAAVANVIPPQQAGLIAQRAGVTDKSGWCPIEPTTFASTLQPDIHVIGDAAIANAMPKSAFAANAQAKLCAAQIVRTLRGEPPLETTLLNTCYSLVAPGFGISVAGVYQPQDQCWAEIQGAGGVSPLAAPIEVRELEARYAEDWFRVITHEVFG